MPPKKEDSIILEAQKEQLENQLENKMNPTKEHEKKMFARVEEANRKIAKAVCLIESAHIDLDYVFDNTDWDSMVLCDLDEALVKLAYVVSSFCIWDEDLEDD